METSAQQATERIESVKVRILGVATLLVVVAVLPGHLVTVLLAWDRGTLELANILHASLFVGGAVIMVLLQGARPRLRAGFILGYILALGAVGVLLYGAQIVDGGIFALSVVFGVVYFRWKGLVGVLAMTTLILVTLATAFSQGWVEVPPVALLDLRDPANGVRTLVGLMVISLALGFFIVEVMEALDDAIEKLSAAIEEQRQERMARRRTQAVLEQSQRLETIGRLAGGVAHDFNNALVVILGTAQLLERSEITTERQRRLAAAIEEAAWQASDVSKQLLTFSRRNLVRPENVDVDESLRHIQRVLKRLLPEDISVQISAESDSSIWLDRSELDQVFFHLAIHAHDTMRSGGSLTFSSRRERRSSGDGVEAPLGVVIEVVDDGAGMSPDAAARAFDPIDVTATGMIEQERSLGLHLVRDIVEAAGGRVDCDSRLGEGTRFRLWFPEQLPSEASGPRQLPAPDERRGRILVLEASVEVRALLGHILRAGGYEVVPVASVAAARAAMSEGAFELICSDASLPDGPARALLEEVTALEGSPPILLCSGPISDAWLNTLIAEGRAKHLAKPFGSDDLLTMVARLLGAAEGEPRG